MIWLIYLALGLGTLYVFYRSKKFWQLTFLVVLSTSYLASTEVFANLPFVGRVLVFLLGLTSLLYFLFELNKDYKEKKLETRRQLRQEKEK